MSEPRNVTPDPETPAGQPTAQGQPEWWSWTSDNRRRGFPLFGVLLVLIGVALLVQYVAPQVSVGTLILVAVGLAFLAAWIFGRSWFAMVPGFLVLALGVSELIEDFALFLPAGEDVPGLASTALAIGFLAIWAIANVSGRRWTWPLWGAAIFGVIGVAQLSTYVALPQLGVIVPVLVIVVGVIVLLSWGRRS